MIIFVDPSSMNVNAIILSLGERYFCYILFSISLAVFKESVGHLNLNIHYYFFKCDFIEGKYGGFFLLFLSNDFHLDRM